MALTNVCVVYVSLYESYVIIFHVRRSRCEMCSGHGCVPVCLFLATFPLLTILHGLGSSENGKGCLVVVQYWADLQSVHGFRCYDNVAPNAKCQRVLVLALCPVYFAVTKSIVFGYVFLVKVSRSR